MDLGGMTLCILPRSRYSNQSAAYAHDLVSSLKRASFKGKAILYLHPFISTEQGAAEKYKDDRQLHADGTQVPTLATGEDCTPECGLKGACISPE